MRNNTTDGAKNWRVRFQDTGQDFVEWIVSASGEVLACTPFQSELWVGRIVVATHMVDGNLRLILEDKDGAAEYNLKHPVASMVETDQVGFSEQALAL